MTTEHENRHNMKRLRWVGAVLLAQILAGDGLAEDTNIIQQLQRRIEELEQKVKTLENAASPPKAATNEPQPRLDQLEQKLEALQQDQQANAAKTRKAPQIRLGDSGMEFSSADDAFKFRVRGYLQADGRFYLNDPNHAFTDTFLLNRVRPVFEGTVFRNFDYKMMPDFGQGRTAIQDAYVDGHFTPWLNLLVGKYKSPVGLERLQSARDLIFVERALPADIVPNRDIGVQLHGEFFKGGLEYALGVYNGVADGGSGDTDEYDSKDIAGRVFAYPFKRASAAPLQGLGLGIAGTTGHENGAAPAYKTIAQQTFFSFNPGVTANGNRDRISPQGFYYWGPLGFLGEYVVSFEDINKGAVRQRLANSAWQASAFYVVTGERASYTGVMPARPFNPAQGRWGALELAARVSQLHVDGAAFENIGTPSSSVYLADRTKSASDVTAWSLGFNWYLNRGVKFMFDYEHSGFKGGAPTGNRAHEDALLSRVQVVF